MPTVVVSAAIFDDLGRICCVQQTYGGMHWALPGGGLEPGESPLGALEREVREETVYAIRVGRLIGVYSAPWQDRLVLCLGATLLGRGPWAATGEIAAVGFFGRDELPEPMTPRMRHRIHDAFDGKIGVMHVFEEG